jgi:hypothetical protein
MLLCLGTAREWLGLEALEGAPLLPLPCQPLPGMLRLASPSGGTAGSAEAGAEGEGGCGDGVDDGEGVEGGVRKPPYAWPAARAGLGWRGDALEDASRMEAEEAAGEAARAHEGEGGGSGEGASPSRTWMWRPAAGTRPGYPPGWPPPGIASAP